MNLIYIIEDETVLLELIRLNLEIEGYKVEGIQSGKVAYNEAKKISEADLVILDVMLPEVNGLDVCKEIRRFSEVPILFLSAKGTTSDRVAGLKLGANDYLPKPFDLEELILKVKILISSNTLSIPEKTVLKIRSSKPISRSHSYFFETRN
jgi:two-component system alkaline phosphatase synthesis response regulator PhoP